MAALFLLILVFEFFSFGNYEKKSSVSSDLNVSFKRPKGKKLKKPKKAEKVQPNVLIGLFVHFPFENIELEI